MKKFIIFIILFAHLRLGYFFEEKIELSLNGIWSACNTNGSICVKATVPGCIHRDLELAGIVKDFVRGFEDKNQIWIAESDWVYRREFEVSSAIFRRQRIVLNLKGLDTVSRVYVNDNPVAETRNMFLEFVFVVQKWLRLGRNSLTIHFFSPVEYAAKMAKQYPYPVPPVSEPSVEHGFNHPMFIRKEQSSFGWDWGPAAASMGIYKNVSLIAFNQVRITHVVPLVIRKSRYVWEVKGKVSLEKAPEAKNETFCVTYSIYELNVTETKCLDLNENGPSMHGFEVRNPVDLWWPNGMGRQKLYVLRVEVKNAHSMILDSHEKRFGFRVVELVQRPVDPKGLTFFFRVNGENVFLKGSNWIPARVCPANVTRETELRLLSDAKKANMNALRVWGGGVYESETFYDLADELGILLWQDMMFACAMYPANQDFLASVREEIRYQVRRIASHPSVLIWAGNNENEKALRQNWYGTGSNFSLYLSDYKNLYMKLVQSVVETEDPTRPFVLSSPSNGDETIKQGGVALNPADPLYGDVHPYRYVEDGWDWRTYPRARFVSEFGIQSLPSLDSLRYAAATDDPSVFNLTSEWMRRRQHHPDGYKQILSEIRRHFEFPSTKKKFNSSGEFDDLIFLSQVNQAMSIKSASEYFLSCRSSVDAGGRGLTMGAMYWQLNDVWTAPTWSSIEYSGKWKMLHFFAKNFFSSLVVAPFLVNNGMAVDVYGISDFRRDAVNLTLQIDIRGFADFRRSTWNYSVANIDAQSSSKIAQFSLEELVREERCHAQAARGLFSSDCFLTIKLWSSFAAAENVYFPQSFARAKIGKAVVRVSGVDLTPVVSESEFVFNVRISTTAPAFFVWLSVEGIDGAFQDNGFHVLDEVAEVEFKSSSPNISPEIISIKHLAMTVYDY